MQTDTYNQRVRRIELISGVVSTFVGSRDYGSVDGQGMAATFYNPVGIAVDSAGTVALVVSPLATGLFASLLALAAPIYLFRRIPAAV